MVLHMVVLWQQVRNILDAKGKVGLGVDGSSSNETVNLLDDCRIATYLQRSGGNPKGDSIYAEWLVKCLVIRWHAVCYRKITL